jgi:hypothetical protein
VREVEPGAGEESVEEAGRILHAPQPGIDERGQLAEAARAPGDRRAGHRAL